MTRPLWLTCGAVLSLGLAACSTTTSAPDPGVRTEDAGVVDLDDLHINVSGRVAVLPEAQTLLQAHGQAPLSIDGAPLTIEEPLRVAVHDTSATVGAGTLASDGAFHVTHVSVRDIHQGLAVGVSHEGLAHCTSIIFDTAFTGTRPHTDLVDAQAWVLPTAFVQALDTAIGETRLRAHTEGRASTLEEAGFIMGRVVDTSGHPVTGVRVVPDRTELSDRVYYPSEDLSTVNQDGTSGSGLFVYVHTAKGLSAFHLSVEGAGNYVPRNVGASAGLGIVLTMYPGRFPPP
ncbi:carboxypeptidase regulatory-like domain-containing protein [Myxococcaceae bacterium JPH2]|nr:carboxypeptidase regulatory-like domain-containing protein [Myxococcaceae bacterium JPH2]